MWYAIRTAPQREMTVHAMLRRKGYTVYLPVEEKPCRSRKPAQKATIHVPMFSGYIFVQYPFSWPHLRSERHIIGAVSVTNDGIASPIADDQINRMISGSMAYLAKVKASKPRAVATGDLAKIAYGYLVGQTVTVTNLRGRKARVFLALFGREVEISREALEAA